jgi:cytoskeletal protein RodZ
MSIEPIGQKLKVARESKGLTLRQIYEKTKIPIGHLQSIDNGMSDDLPEPVYVAGFIKRYADCVGLNGQTLSDEYRRDAEKMADGSSRKGTSQAVYTAPIYVDKVKIDNGPPTFKTIYFNALWVVVIVGLISYLSMTQFNNNGGNDPTLAGLKDSASKVDTQTPQAPANTAQTAKPDTANVALSATQHVWVEVKSVASGENLFTGYLEQGDRRDFQDPQGLVVRAGNGSSVNVSYLGKVESLGNPNESAEKTFMAQNPKPVAEATAQTPSTTTPSTTATSSTSGSAVTSAPVRRPRVAASSEGEAPRKQRYRRIEGISRQDSSDDGGTRSIDVPYRINEGRLDSE